MKILFAYPIRVQTGLAAAMIFLMVEGAYCAELDDLRATVDQMQETITSLKARISDLEKARAREGVANDPRPATATSLTTATMQATHNQAPPATPAPVNSRYPGYIPLPSTPFLVRFNFKPRLDLTVDSQNPGDKYRFVTEKLPLRGSSAYGGGEQSNLNANGTQIDLDIRAPDEPGNFRLHYQNDFFGSDSSDMKYRLRHAYAEYYGFVAGFTYGIFEDPDGWPDTLDYEGPNSVIFARRALIHYRFALNSQWLVTLGVEKPDIFVDTNLDSSISVQSRMPDAGFNVRWEQEGAGHLQLSSIFRSIGAQGDNVGNQRVFGWGVDASASVNLTKRDILQAWLVYGEGIGGLGNDSGFENTDAAYDTGGKLHALRYFSALAGYTHQWNDRWRSTLSYGYVNVENTSGQATDAYHVTHYCSANLVYQINKQFSIGLEELYGRREVRDGSTGDDFRLQLSMLYSMF